MLAGELALMDARATGSGGRERVGPPAASLAPRVAALLLDWATGCALGLLLAVVAWLWWLATSDGGIRQPSDAAIYAGLGILTASVPLWAIGTV